MDDYSPVEIHNTRNNFIQKLWIQKVGLLLNMPSISNIEMHFIEQLKL